MTIRCKLHCASVTHTETGNWDPKLQKSVVAITHEVQLFAVTGDSPENKEFFASTPSGHLLLKTVRDDLFVPGLDYYVDLTPVTPV